MRLMKCDRCGKEFSGLPNGHTLTFDREGRFGGFLYSDYELCNSCTHELKQWIRRGIPKIGDSEEG